MTKPRTDWNGTPFQRTREELVHCHLLPKEVAGQLSRCLVRCCGYVKAVLRTSGRLNPTARGECSQIVTSGSRGKSQVCEISLLGLRLLLSTRGRTVDRFATGKIGPKVENLDASDALLTAALKTVDRGSNHVQGGEQVHRFWQPGRATALNSLSTANVR